MIDKNEAIENILKSYETIGGINHLDGENLPSRHSVNAILDLLKQILFPGYFENTKIERKSLPFIINQKVTQLQKDLTEELVKSICWKKREDKVENNLEHCQNEAKNLAENFINFIPKLREILKDDAKATLDGDPAANSLSEVIMAYPGFLATTIYRIAHYFHGQKVSLIPRLMTEIAHSQTGIDIHPGATIGVSFCIDHGTGIVIGETAILGKNVKLYQGVTIGALSVQKDQAEKKRHPTLEDQVTVYARTTILGGNTVIGKNTVVGGNLWITTSVPANSKVYQIDDASHRVKTLE